MCCLFYEDVGPFPCILYLVRTRGWGLLVSFVKVITHIHYMVFDHTSTAFDVYFTKKYTIFVTLWPRRGGGHFVMLFKNAYWMGGRVSYDKKWSFISVVYGLFIS